MENLITLELLMEAGTAAVAAAVYASIWYMRARQKGEEFDYKKYLSTVIVGFGIGFFLGLMGDVVSFDTVQEQLAGYAGAVAMVEGILKVLKEKYWDK